MQKIFVSISILRKYQDQVRHHHQDSSQNIHQIIQKNRKVLQLYFKIDKLFLFVKNSKIMLVKYSSANKCIKILKKIWIFKVIFLVK